MEMCVVRTKNGAVRGSHTKDVYEWLGIPYAQPPTGELRFKPARPVHNWDDVRDASAYGPVCFQNRKKAVMSEDCLTLNIWSPDPDNHDAKLPCGNSETPEKRAVLFFIHGGSFCSGSGSERDINGAKLAGLGDVVVVTVNYRLGVLGFLDFSFLGKDFYPNCGLTDIVEALRWTHENIEAFGGDPDNITVFGQSAGAIAASVLPIIAQARPCLSKVIMMSGDPTLLHTREQYQQTSRKFLEFMHIDKPETLFAMSAEELTARQREFSKWCRMGAGTFMLEIDGELIPEYPIPAVMKGAAKDIPILIGTTREEMSVLFIKPLAEILDVNSIMDVMVDEESPETREGVQAAYQRYGKRGPIWMMSDIVFRIGSSWYAEAYSAYADTWMYRFDYETFAMKLTNLHAFHSCDIPFVFGNNREGMARWMFALSPYKGGIRRVSNEIRADFITFAKTGRLPWQRCLGGSTPGKCYGRKPSVIHMVEPEVKAEFNRTQYRRRSFEGYSNTTPDTKLQ
jgi:para-nitrobenzyl esterase